MSAPPLQLPLHKFRDPALERTALTHRSFGRPHNERLEWLGDSILNTAVTLILWERFPTLDEGRLTELRTVLVRNDTLAAAARRSGFPQRLRLGGAENNSGGRDKNSLLSSALEAYLGAVQLDGGDAGAVARALLAPELEECAAALERGGPGGLDRLKDPKTRLQEVLQKYGRPLPIYSHRQYMRANRPFFRVECQADGQIFQGRGKNVARAEKAAAENALYQMEQSGQLLRPRNDDRPPPQ